MNQLYSSDTIYKIPNSRHRASEEVLQSMLVICKKSDLENGGKDLLLQIIGALNWKVDEDCSVLALDNNESISVASYLENDTKLIISFGLEEKELCLQAYLPHYVIGDFENGAIVRSHYIQELLKNKEYKGALWSSIKQYKK